MAHPTDQDRPWIDTTEFTRTAAHLSGHRLVAGFGRLADMLTDTAGAFDWSLGGERQLRADGGHEALLTLQFSGSVRMVCVRCLEPVALTVQDQRQFKLVIAESVAEREDQQTDAFDLLVSTAHLDVMDLLEDEAIMALPLAPRHENCQPPPGALVVPEGETERGAAAGEAAAVDPAAGQRPNPFAVLAQLRSRPVNDDGQN